MRDSEGGSVGVLTRRPGRRLLRVGIPVVLVAVVLAGAGCGLLGEPRGRPVTIVGDSLTVLGENQIRDVLQPAGWKVAISAYPGVTAATEMPALTKAAKDRHRPIVIELGTNDAHALAQGETDPAAERATIAQVVALFAPTQCLVWVNADANRSRPGGPGGQIVNDALTAAAAKRAALHVADLNALLQSHPEYLLGDGVHLTDVGSTALGHLIADALTACG